MTANSRDQSNRKVGIDNQDLESATPNRNEQDSSKNQQESNAQIGRLESQPGTLSGVSTEEQRSRSGNQDLGSRGTDQQGSEKL